jgi:hypothetical protein
MAAMSAFLKSAFAGHDMGLVSQRQVAALDGAVA